MTQETRYQPYQIIRRKNRAGKTVFYVRFVDTRTGRTIKEKSSGQTSRTAAVRWAEVEYQKMQDTIVEAQTISAIADGFWDWDASYARHVDRYCTVHNDVSQPSENVPAIAYFSTVHFSTILSSVVCPFFSPIDSSITS